MATIDCRSTSERLPWYLTGSLPDGERESIRGHLEGCAACRAELEATRRMLAIAGAHAPAGLLADYAAGFAIDSECRRALEDHVAACPTCSEELAMALAEPAEGSSPGPGSRAPAGGWRVAAIAAALVAFVATGLLVRDRTPSPTAAAEVALVELLPAGDRVRAAGDDPPEVSRRRAATVVLVSDRVPEGDAYRLVVRAAATSRAAATLEGLTPDPAGAFVVHVPAGAWPVGELSLAIEAVGPGGSEPFATWVLRRTD